MNPQIRFLKCFLFVGLFIELLSKMIFTVASQAKVHRLIKFFISDIDL